MSLLTGIQEWRWINQAAPLSTESALYSFATDDVLSESISKEMGMSGLLRSWCHPKTIVVGIQDQRLPYFKEAVQFLKESGYDVVMRHSGGLAVVLDEGVYNLSLILNEPKESISIDDCYEAMKALISEMFADFPVEIEAKEIVHSYCPGSYDLSINGKKFAGISQRRANGAIAVQIYLSVNGNQAQRADLIRDFYAIGKKGEETRIQYPVVKNEVMSTLSDLLAIPLSLEDVNQRLLTLMQTNEIPLTEEEYARLPYFMERLKKRNQAIVDY